MAAAQLPRDPLQPPPTRLQPQHLRYVVRRLHHLPPWIGPRRAFRDSLLVHSLSPQLSKEGAIPRDAEGAIFHGARHWSTPAIWRYSCGPVAGRRSRSAAASAGSSSTEVDPIGRTT